MGYLLLPCSSTVRLLVFILLLMFALNLVLINMVFNITEPAFVGGSRRNYVRLKKQISDVTDCVCNKTNSDSNDLRLVADSGPSVTNPVKVDPPLELIPAAALPESVKLTNKKKSGHFLCVVVPFRERLEELLIFIPYMTEYLNNSKHGADHYNIIVLNQVDEFRFNRAALINVGAIEAQKLGCDYLAMHDVDLMPRNQNLSYAFPDKGPYHLASPWYHPRYRYKTFIGGIMIITMQHFLLVNGLSNRYWGWGVEDDEFYTRIQRSNLTIFRPEKLTTTRENTFYHIHNKKHRKRDMKMLFDQKEETYRIDWKGGINSVKYEIVSRTDSAFSNCSFRFINVMIECDIAETPWCYNEDDIDREKTTKIVAMMEKKKKNRHKKDFFRPKYKDFVD